MSKTLYIIDGHALIYAAYFAPMSQRLSSPTGEPTKAAYIFTTGLVGMLARNKPDMVVVAMDSKAPSFRTKIYKEYKAQRPPMPDDLPGQITRVEQILEAMRIPMLRIDGWEADDIIGTLAKKAAAKGMDVLICSKDKDMLQLLNEHVAAYDIKSDKKFGVEELKKEMDVTPHEFLDALALQGDKVDNVPGIPDVGPKTALQWIQEYHTIENLYKHADEITGKRGESLRASREAVKLSKKLVTIDCDAPVELDAKAFAVKEFDKVKLAHIFNELGFHRLLAQLDISPKEAGPASQQGGLFAETPAEGAISPVGSRQTSKNTPHEYHLLDTPETFNEFVKELAKQKLFAADTETTSLGAMRTELVAISVSWAKHTGWYIPVKAPMGQKCLDVQMVCDAIGPIFANEHIKKIGQNIKFDMLVLENAKMPLAGVYFDTMVAAYVLDAARMSNSMDALAADFLNYQPIPISDLIGSGKKQTTFDMVDTATACEYSAEDADVTWWLYEVLSKRLEHEPQLKKLFYDLEMPLVTVLAKMERAGVSIDAAVLRKLSSQITKDLDEAAERVYEHAGMRFNIDSPKQLSEVLFDRLGLASVKEGKTGRSTDADVLDQLENAHPVVKDILEYRQLSKLKNTYVDKLGGLVNQRTGRLHASFNQTVTTTGRLSSSDPNLQNIPIRTKLGRQIRSAFVPAAKDDCILSADYSQIELRMLAHFSKDPAMMEAFAHDKDIHRFVASQVYGIPLEEVTDEQRSRCKTVNFGIIYGQGPFGLSKTTGMPQHEAKKFIEDYFKRYSAIKVFMDKTIEDARSKGYAETILHRRRTITGLDARNFNVRSQAERLAFNTVLQGSSADLIKVAMVNIQRHIDKENLPVKMIHDELVFELPASQAEKHGKWIAHQMAGAIKLDVPLKVDISSGPNWMK
jgi:DNA polymerase-1